MKNEKSADKRGLWFLAAAVFSSLAATLCCLPALLFLIFGASFSFLSWADALSDFRGVFSAFGVACFAASTFFAFRTAKSCGLGCAHKKRIVIYVLLAILLGFLLFYPEILGSFYA